MVCVARRTVNYYRTKYIWGEWVSEIYKRGLRIGKRWTWARSRHQWRHFGAPMGHAFLICRERCRPARGAGRSRRTQFA